MSRERKRAVLPPAQEHIDRLEKLVKEGNYYRAQQMYKSISTRYVNAERFSEALDILESGACLQLEEGQEICGAELALIFAETLEQGKIPCDDQSLGRVKKIYSKFPRGTLPSNLEDEEDMQKLTEALGVAKIRVDGCSSFLKAAIRWSAVFGPDGHGSPILHLLLAEYAYSESPEPDMAKVTYHFVRGNDPSMLASTLVNFMSKCYPGEDDLAIARAILRYLSSGNLKDAKILMEVIKREAEAADIEFPQTDLMQFVSFLLPTLERNVFPLFTMLRSKYKLCISREPGFNEMIDAIAEKFYGVQRRNAMGMFEDIFKTMKMPNDVRF
ncbi:Golgi to ER traffic protein 4 homolog [Neltuma alba]|uniref:Golgi to ER traffic protein 4 homolog n=1 Tax=Neltuma alba TaxID=207710 RepID=UPI0010A50DFE|nr:Golgi to ER traffic protein 4 homolog [Prosopis alba]